MSRPDDFLLELGTEELPADVIPEAMRVLTANAAELLGPGQGFVWKTLAVWATPRRLVLHVCGLAPTVRWERVGPAKAAAYDAQGRPTAAARGFAKSQGVAVSALQLKETPRGLCVVATRTALAIPKLAEMVPELVKHLRFPKQMQWEASGMTFARPIRWLLTLCGATLVPCRVAGVVAGRKTAAHRRATASWLTVRTAAEYFAVIRRAGIHLEQHWTPLAFPPSGPPAAHPAPPKATALHRQLAAAAARLGGRLGEGEEFDRLLTTVSFLTERPVVQSGSFRRKYLALPAEVLATAMAKYLKVFHLRTAQGRLLPKFLVALEGCPTAPRRVMANYERILEARFTDAQLFWREDTKTPLEAKVPQLAGVVFHQRLGTLEERIGRLTTLVQQGGAAVADAAVSRAVQLANADLVTQMVKEFPTLQGMMGAEYARHDGEPQAVVQALREQYLPRTAGDPVPATAAGAWLSLLDRVDTLTGYFGIGLAPTSSEDPYGLRRQALGLVRILVEKSVSQSLDTLFAIALESWGPRLTTPVDECRRSLKAFVLERFRWWACEVRRYPRELVDAVLAASTENLADVARRLEALHALWRDPRQREDILFTAGKVIERTGRIVEAAKDPSVVGAVVDPAKFVTPEEQALWTQWTLVRANAAGLIERHEYAEASAAYRELYPTLHRFFEKVFVMDENLDIRRNRLAMLGDIHFLYVNAIGDLSKLPLPTEVQPG